VEPPALGAAVLHKMVGTEVWMINKKKPLNLCCQQHKENQAEDSRGNLLWHTSSKQTIHQSAKNPRPARLPKGKFVLVNRSRMPETSEDTNLINASAFFVLLQVRSDKAGCY